MLLDTLATSLRNSNVDAFVSASNAPKSLAVIIMTYGKSNILELFGKYGIDITLERSKDIFTKMGYDILMDNGLEVAIANSNLNITKEEAILQVISESVGAFANEKEVRCALCLKAIYQ